jgi:hypothetical protein
MSIMRGMIKYYSCFLLLLQLDWARSTFQINFLDATGCVRIEHEPGSGDDRGGIAVSTTSVFYTGDFRTGLFPLDLSSGTVLGQRYDALTSDLRTGQVYSLGDGATPLEIFISSTLNSLIEIDGTTGTTGSFIALSTPIALPGVNGNIGIFAGWGQVVIHNSVSVFAIAVPSGIVTDVGLMPVPPHRFCESWAYWGVAEFFSNQLYITYVRDSQAIVRTPVPSGISTALATFSSLSDMCSFTVSPGSNRWYWHHKFLSQFGGVDESIGYCDASFIYSGGATSDPHLVGANG